MFFFKCKHPAAWLVVEKQQTVEPVDADYEKVTYHMTCFKCNEKVKIKHFRFIGGVKEFMKRGKA